MNAPEKFTMKKTLTKADIVEAIYEETDKNRVDVKNVVEQLLEIMKTAIKKDRALLISGFGKFECYDKASRKGRNPQTDETITLPPRKVMVFRLSRKFRSELNLSGNAVPGPQGVIRFARERGPLPAFTARRTVMPPVFPLRCP